MNENVDAFLKVLDAEDNSTGGGTASAIAGAMAAALGAMVARLSIGKPDLEPESFYQDRGNRLTELSEALFHGGGQDSQAFAAVRSAFRMPKASDDEKKIRREAIQAAWLQAAQTPRDNASRCLETLELLSELEGRSNENAASDLACGLYLAAAGAKGCLDNVDINIPMIKNAEMASQLEGEVQALRQKLA
jgi:formiminotetrahydrofolate cyclodeaminase